MKLLDKTAETRAQQAFMAYVLDNYGPGCVLANPSWHAPKLFRAALRAIEDARVPYVLPPAWIPVGERRPERNASVLYWHRPVEPRGPGWLAQADEWRDEQHLPIATHWMPMPKEPASISLGEDSK